MYLEKLEIQGFKSFANKNVLVFPGMLDQSKRGLTSIVGPNGSGKSNVADAVRWALGEQSMKTLRGKKSEDVIFSGSDKKGRLGMAEVSLYLNNEDRAAPLDYSQVVITRRLYRDGNSEYMINNNRSRLADIQMMLARAKFGQKTYSVIGQGMVEGFLNTSLAERKEFFDEATGVKQFQIKRDESLNKLLASYENLNQVTMLLSEIEPRLRSLTRQVNRLKRRDEIETELRRLQLKYYGRIWHEINAKFNEYNTGYLGLEKEKITKEKKISALLRELERLEQEDTRESEFSALQNELSEIQNEKEELNKKLARLEAEMEMKLEAAGQFDLSFLVGKKEELTAEVKKIREEIAGFEKQNENDREYGRSLGAEKEKIDRKIEEMNAGLSELGGVSDENEMKKINARFAVILEKIRAIDAETDMANVKAGIGEIKKLVAEAAAMLEAYWRRSSAENGGDGQWRQTHLALSELSGRKEERIQKINENEIKISARLERVKLLRERLSKSKDELERIGGKIARRTSEAGIAEADKEKGELRDRLADAENKINAVRERIERKNAAEEEKKNRLFSLQKDLRALQNEVNSVNTRLNELKINSTRYETRLEGLEIEIRQELGSLEEIKRSEDGGEVEEEAKDKIAGLKHQLELIGGIDPQIEQEYNETKERYDFLSGQVDDLTKAVDSLQKIIKELDLNIKERFDKEFKVISRKFEQYFKTLFNGGSAKIIKIMEDEARAEEEETGEGEEEGAEKEEKKKEEAKMADIKKIKFLRKHNATGLAGIEIQAMPPGKKIRAISMLSGGERALTAIAMICAIISANPSPFVVLDEVDASLDEANSERLAKILDELSHKTQFIVITHNRATMRRAHILYGITMGDDGASKLLSIKLEEATKHVSR